MRLPRNRKFIPSSERHAALDYQLPPLLRNLRRGMTVFTITFLAAIAYVVFWFTVAALFRGGLNDWAANMRNNGYRIQYTEPVLGGFPFSLRLDLGKLEISTPEKSGYISWASRDVVITTHPWRMDIIAITLKKQHHLTYRVNRGGSESYIGDAYIKAVLNFDIGSKGPVAAKIRIRNLIFDDTGTPYHLAVDKADIAFTRNTDANIDYKTSSLDMRFSGKGLEVPEKLSWPLGHRIQDISFNGAVLGPIGSSGTWPDRLSAWRDIGGTLEVSELNTVYGPMTISASGTMALDENIQPIGAFSAKIEGFFKTIDMLKRNGFVRSAAATTAKLVLGVMAQRSKNGGTPSLNLAITAQNRKLFAGPVLLARIPEINWGD